MKIDQRKVEVKISIQSNVKVYHQYSMSTPRPLGVRRAGDFQDNSYMHVTRPPTRRPFNPLWARGSARSRSLHPHCLACKPFGNPNFGFAY